jgi:hypothetical protein
VRTPRIEKLNASLLAALSASPPGERLAFLEQVAAWARSHRDACRTETLEQLGLDRLLELDLARYPTGSSALDPADELASLRRAPAPSRDALAMRLRDILWQGVTVESAATCPVVPSAFGLRVLVSSVGDQIVLSCDSCSWAQGPDGRLWTGESSVVPPTTERFERWRRTGR